MAHIGVLQWFEDHHIPIEYIAGTSMGGLVGGLYAIGYSPAEIKRIIAILPYSDTRSFDSFPIPFRCVATDLVSGKPVVFKDGSLANALRPIRVACQTVLKLF